MSIEHQNAFALSKMEYESACQSTEIERLLSDGKYVVGFRLEIHCPFTDAYLSCEERIVSIHDTKEDAEANYEHDEVSFLAIPPNTKPTSVITSDINNDDRPF